MVDSFSLFTGRQTEVIQISVCHCAYMLDPILGFIWGGFEANANFYIWKGKCDW